MNDEIQPFLICRVMSSQMEFALWQLLDGQRGLCLFLAQESADQYRAYAHPSAEWKTIQPDLMTLWEILKASDEAGIRWGVLEPDQEKAKRIFNLNAITQTVVQSQVFK